MAYYPQRNYREGCGIILSLSASSPASELENGPHESLREVLKKALKHTTKKDRLEIFGNPDRYSDFSETSISTGLSEPEY